MSDVWKNVLAEVKQEISQEHFSTWFPDTSLTSIENDVVTISVPNVFKLKQLQVKYSEIIKTAFKNNGVTVRDINYIVQGSTKPKVRAREISISQASSPRPITKRVSSTSTNEIHTGLNSKYRLDNFVIGSNNDLAVSVAQNIVDQPGKNYNPFFLYGGPGLGKTHLVQAIGNELLQRDPKLRVLYMPVSTFYTDFINAVKNNRNKGEEFRQRFMQLDALIIDDIQMIVGKEGSQIEFFDIFNKLYDSNKQIIVTSDRLPAQIKEIDERLVSRLAWGGVFDIQLPKFEDKCAILKSKAEFNGIEIEDEAIAYLAENVKTNIRDLEGEFNHLLAVADLKNMTPLEVIREGYISTSRLPQNKAVSPKQIVDKVAKFYQITVKELSSKSRVSHIKNARQVAMYMLSKELGMSTPKIALEVGVKDHTTVMHGIKKIDEDLKLNFLLRDQIVAIREKIYA